MKSAMPLKESDILRAIRDYLKHLPRTYYIRQQQGLGSRRGVPDLTACIDGRFVAIEVKRDNGRLTPEQERELHLIKRAGGISIVARSVDDVHEALLEAGIKCATQMRLI